MSEQRPRRVTVHVSEWETDGVVACSETEGSPAPAILQYKHCVEDSI